MTHDEAFKSLADLSMENASRLGTLKGMVKVLEIDREHGTPEMVEKSINELVAYVRKLDEERGK